MPGGGCVRGEKCLFSHPAAEFMSLEIKGAVPRFELPVLEVSRVESDTHSFIELLDLNEAEVKELSTCNQTSSLAEPQQTTSLESTPSCLSGFPSAGVCTVSGGTSLQSFIREVPPESALPSFGCPSANVSNVSRDHSVSQSVMRVSSSNTLLGRKPTWLNAFKEWLADFLSRVSTRLKDGEWYPLSSLKGDYRAICDLELDHASLCRMKVVPVGRGPATRLVLLPPMNRNIPSAAGRRNISNITTRSLVDGTRSYAEVACHGSAARIGRFDAVPPSNAAFCTNGSNLGHQGKHAGPPAPSGGMTSVTDHQPAYGLHQGLLMRGNGPSTAVAGDNADVKASCDGPPKTSLTYSDGHSRSGLIRRTSKSWSSRRYQSASQDAPPANHASIGSWPALVAMHEHHQNISPLQAYGDKTRRGSMWVAMAFRAAELRLTTLHLSFTREYCVMR